MIDERQKILVVLIAGIGDLVLASRALRALRNGFPDGEIHLLTSTDAAPLACRYGFLTKVWAFPIRELRKGPIFMRDALKVLLALRRLAFREAVNLYTVGSFFGAMKMGLLFLVLKAAIKTGQDAWGFGFFLTQKLSPRLFTKRHFSDAMMEIAVSCGGIPDGRGIEVSWDRRCEPKWNGLFEPAPDAGGRSMVIGVNPGGDRLNRRWDPDRYAHVADRLAERFHAAILILGGPGEEGIAGRIAGRMKQPSVNLAGRMSLDDLAYIISRLDLLLTNDSGPMHIGAAAGTPLVALFGPEDPVLMGPYTREDLFRIVHKEVPCRPCPNDRCKGIDCLSLITPAEVFEKCVDLLAVHRPSSSPEPKAP